jgi:hypothetical protein
MGMERDLGDRLAHARRALDPDLAVTQLEIADVRLEHVAGDPQHLLLDLLGR